MRSLLMVCLAFVSVSAFAEKTPKFRQPLSFCEQKVMANAVEIKQQAIELIRGMEDQLDANLDSGNPKPEVSEKEKSEMQLATLALNEIRAMQMGRGGTGLLDPYCKRDKRGALRINFLEQ